MKDIIKDCFKKSGMDFVKDDKAKYLFQLLCDNTKVNETDIISEFLYENGLCLEDLNFYFMNAPIGADVDCRNPAKELHQPAEYLTVEVEVHFEGEEDENFQTVLFEVEIENKRADIAREAKDWCVRKGLVYVDWFLAGVKE